MSPAQQILFRHALLRQLAVAAPAALDLETLRHGVRLAGFDPSHTASQIAALQDKTWISDQSAVAHAGFHRYRLTTAGRAYAEREGLA